MKIEFHCAACDTTFEMSDEYLQRKSEIVCPTCGNKLPNNILASLKEAAAAVSKANREEKEYIQKVGAIGPMIYHLNLE